MNARHWLHSLHSYCMIVPAVVRNAGSHSHTPLRLLHIIHHLGHAALVSATVVDEWCKKLHNFSPYGLSVFLQ